MKNTVNSVRFLAIDAINKANSGHPGMVLGAAPMATELFLNHLKATPKDSRWINRDRFVLAAGHGSSMLYSLLHHMGYGVSLEDMKNFRQLHSNTPGHPELGYTHGVDATSGPLGQGIAQAAGIAAAEKFLSGKYNREGFDVFDHYTYALCGDGDLQEGVTLETMDWAGNVGLGKLIVLFDSNDIQLDGPVKNANSVDWKVRCESMNWEYILVEDGENTDAISNAINKAKINVEQPTLIEVKTVIGKGTTKAGLSDTHGAPIGEEERAIAAENLGFTGDLFSPLTEALELFREAVIQKDKKLEEWSKMFANYKKEFSSEADEIIQSFVSDFELVNENEMNFKLGEKHATRNVGGKVISALSKLNPTFIGGSADLTKSTKAKGNDGDFPNINARNINFGVREFAMTAIINGMSIHGGVKPFSGAFFVFSDYAKPAIRMAALQKIAPIYVYTHDSLAVGEDGPTHQPVEQLIGLRAIPNVNVIRPCDANETVAAFNLAMKETEKPTIIVLSRQDLEVVSNVTLEDIENGAYIVKKEVDELKLTVIATGSEVSLVVAAVNEMKNKNVRVVSMPSTNMYDQLSQDEKELILPKGVKTVFIEAGSTFTGYKYASEVYGIDKFGESAPGDLVMSEYGFDQESIKNYLKEKIRGEY